MESEVDFKLDIIYLISKWIYLVALLILHSFNILIPVLSIANHLFDCTKICLNTPQNWSVTKLHYTCSLLLTKHFHTSARSGFIFYLCTHLITRFTATQGYHLNTWSCASLETSFKHCGCKQKLTHFIHLSLSLFLSLSFFFSPVNGIIPCRPCFTPSPYLIPLNPQLPFWFLCEHDRLWSAPGY